MAPWRLGRAAWLCAAAGPLAAGGGESGPAAVQEFERLWELVALGQLSRGVRQDDVPPLTHLCQYGLDDTTAEIARFLLGRAQPAAAALEIFHADAGSSADPAAEQLLGQLEAEFGALLRRGAPGRRAAGAPGCDLVLFSEAAPRFSLDLVLPMLSEQVVVVWVSDKCVDEQGDTASPNCNYLNGLWEKSALMRRGYCLRGVCMSRVPSEILKDPNVVPLSCDEFATENGSHTAIGEFKQDWFIYWNFFRNNGPAPRVGGRERAGVYVDIGASLPFEYSNTVAFDRCFGWRGVCVEPNPHLAHFLRAYRSCEVFEHCVDDEGTQGKAFSDRDGNVQFTADCLTMEGVLTRGNLWDERIDFLSIDVEHGELSVLQGLPLDKVDIRIILVEVTRGARWLEVDTAVLPHGYAKVAVLGRDVVYVKLEDLQSGGIVNWPLLSRADGAAATMPHGWAEFHQRVIDEELEAEMVRERDAFYAGLRRAR